MDPIIKADVYSINVCDIPTLGRCDQCEIVRIGRHHSMHDVDLFECLDDGVLVLRVAAHVGRPKLRKPRKETRIR